MAEQRYEREIDELLQRIEREQPGPVPFRPRRRQPGWPRAWARLRETVGAQSVVERLMIVALVLVVLTLPLGLFARALNAPLATLAVVCFVAALALSVVGGQHGRAAAADPRGYRYAQHGRSVDWEAVQWRVRQWWKRFRR